MFISVGQPRVDAERLNKILVVVLGMHRSGTSSAAGALVRLGAAAPQHLLAPNADNERGYWESPVIVDLNDAILAAAGSNWKDWRKFDLNKIDALKANALRARAKEALAEEFGDVGFAVMKDPRMCRLMPFWGPVFAEANWSVRALLPIRSPLEVGQSLHCRDGLSPAYGCLLWLRHVLDAEVETRGMARAVLDWPQFLGDRRKALTRVSEQWGLIWPHWDEDAFSEVDEFVSADLRRQRTSEAELEAHPAVNDLVRRTYTAMIDLVRDSGDSCVLKKLDDLRAGFETASAIFDFPMRESAEEVHRVRSEAAAEIAPEPIRTGGREPRRDETRVSFLLETALQRILRPFATRSFSIQRTTSRRTRTFARRDWTPRCTTSFMEAGKAEIPGHFSRPRPISTDTPMSPKPRSTPSCITRRRDADKTE